MIRSDVSTSFPSISMVSFISGSVSSRAMLRKYAARAFIEALSNLIRKSLLKRYRYFIQDLFLQWRETIPFENYEDGIWKYDIGRQREEMVNIIEKSGFVHK